MHEGIVGLDHVLIGVRDLEAARAAYARLGFTVTPRGRHVGWSTGNYCVMFAEDYIELIGVVDPTAPSRSIEKRIAEAGEAGVGVGFALASHDHEAAFRSLDKAGLEPEARSLSRALEAPEGTLEPRFALVIPRDGAIPGIPIFVCRHLTPDLVRRPAWLAHANAAVATTALLAVVPDPAALRAPYERLFGASALGATDRVLSVQMGRTTLLLADPPDAERLYPSLEAGRLSVPAIAAMTIAVEDIGRAGAALDAGPVRHARSGARSLIVDPEDAAGVLLEFTARGRT
jgi:catechol 2,3-dioxygenase-like lactoylglutathione lyase family enzyme